MMETTDGSTRAGSASTERLRALEAFTVVAELGSFSAAAQRLGLGKSAVSKQVARLEDRLGVRLLTRTTRRLSLTPEGEALAERAGRIIADVAEAEAAVTAGKASPRGRLRINAPMSFGQTYIAPILPDFLAAYPGVEVTMSLSDAFVDLAAEGYDVGVRITPELSDSSYVARRLTTMRAMVVAAPSYLAAHGTPAVPADLAEHECLLYDHLATGRHWVLYDGAGQRHTVRVGGRLSANNGEALLAAAMAGQGLARAPAFLVADAIAAGRLVPVLERYSVGEALGVYVMYPESRHLSPKVRAFVDFLAAHMRAQPWERAHPAP